MKTFFTFVCALAFVAGSVMAEGSDHKGSGHKDNDHAAHGDKAHDGHKKGHAKHAVDTINTHCPSTGDKLVAGETIVVKYKGHNIGFCCNHCVKKFHKNSALYIKKLKAMKRQQAHGAKDGEHKNHDGSNHKGSAAKDHGNHDAHGH